jgi:tRNA-modifying protein YgfZ
MTTLFKLPSLTSIRLTGRDRISLLQNLCTQDLRGLTNNSGRELFITDVKGRAIGHGIVSADSDSIQLLLANDDSAKMLSHLDRYIIREDVSLTDESKDTVWYATKGDISEFITMTLPEAVYSWTNADCISAGPLGCAVYRWPVVDVDGFVVGVRSEDQTTFEKLLVDRQCRIGDEQEFAVERIKANWPWYGVDFNEQNLPQEVDRDRQAICFTKGCYLGQETIARLDALGQIQKKLCRIQLEGVTPIDSTKVNNDQGKEVGWITSSAVDPSNANTLAFTFLRRGYFELGTVLQVSGRRCEVI